MNTTLQGAATAYLAPKVLRRFRLHWLLYGAAAYYGLKMMSKRGIFPDQANAALDVIDNGIDFVKGQVGMKPTARRASASGSASMHH